MLNFVGQVEGVTVLDRAFNRIDHQISDFRTIWPYTTPVIYGILGNAFNTEGASTAAGKFKPLVPSYAKRKAIEFPGQTILKRENTLFESMTDPEAADAIYRPERDQLTIGSKTPYARRHQRTRPFISFTEQDKRAITKSIQAGLVQFVRGLGFQVDERAA